MKISVVYIGTLLIRIVVSIEASRSYRDEQEKLDKEYVKRSSQPCDSNAVLLNLVAGLNDQSSKGIDDLLSIIRPSVMDKMKTVHLDVIGYEDYSHLSKERSDSLEIRYVFAGAINKCAKFKEFAEHLPDSIKQIMHADVTCGCQYIQS
ncbi:hypothetical protein AB6A40_005843 [Gnathostoma spinigerum]|uniref:Secreted protein n=1 Tax=Gnathostoma spinigerum TaxID=75299 RepID=A0ABD6ELV6_9BILA